MYTGGHRPPSFAKVADEEEESEERVGGVVHVGINNELPNVLVTNDDGIKAPGLQALVAALVQGGKCNVFVCAPDSEKSGVGHSITSRGTVEVSSVSISGATAFECSGTPVDCVSLAFTGEIFSWRKPTLVVSGINKGSNCGYHTIYSGTVAGAREAFIGGVPALAFSLDWKKGESTTEDFIGAATVSLPLIYSSLQDIEKGAYPQGFFLNVDIPYRPLQHKGYKATRQGTSRLPLNWMQVTQQKRMQMLKDTGIGLQMAQLGMAASAAGAARRANLMKKSSDVESVGVAGGPTNETPQTMHFRLGGGEQEVGETGDGHDFGLLEEGFVTVTALGLTTHLEDHTRAQAEEWISTAVGSFPSAPVCSL